MTPEQQEKVQKAFARSEATLREMEILLPTRRIFKSKGGP